MSTSPNTHQERRNNPPRLQIEKTPSNIDVERAALACAFLNYEAAEILLSSTTPDDWYSVPNRLIFEALQAVSRAGGKIDRLTVHRQLEAAGTSSAAGGPDYLMQLTLSIPIVTHVGQYVKEIREKSLRRGLLGAVANVQSAAYDNAYNTAELIQKAEAAVYGILDGHRSGDGVTLTSADAFSRAAAEIDSGPSVKGIESGIAALDNATHGFAPGEIIVVAGRTTMGKTALGLNIALHNLSEGRSVGIFSLEMSGIALTKRLLGMKTGVDVNRVMAGRVDEDEMRRINNAMTEMSEWRMHLHDQPDADVGQIHSAARRMARSGGVDLLIVDYLGLIRPFEKSRRDNMAVRIAEISRALKMMARELNVPVIVIAQLNRGPESSPDKRPVMSQLRDSGAIEQDADKVILIHRPGYYDKENLAIQRECQLDLAKNRNGMTCIVGVEWEGHTNRFLPLQKALPAWTKHPN